MRPLVLHCLWQPTTYAVRGIPSSAGDGNYLYSHTRKKVCGEIVNANAFVEASALIVMLEARGIM